MYILGEIIMSKIFLEKEGKGNEKNSDYNWKLLS